MPVTNARIHVPNMKEVLEMQRRINMEPINTLGHEQKHAPRTIVYTSLTTLDTVAGSKLKMPRGGQITRIQGKVMGAPSGAAMDIDLLVGGTTVLGGTYLKIPVGETKSNYKYVDRADFSEDSVFQVQIVTVSSATGPLVLTIEYLEEY